MYKKSQDKGIFNLDFEETLILRGRVGRLTKVLKELSRFARTLLAFVIGKGESEKITRKIIELTDEWKEE